MSAPFLFPAPVAAAASWHLSDYRPRVVLRATSAAGGTVTLASDPVPPGYMWSVQRATLTVTAGTAAGGCRLYDSDPAAGGEPPISGSALSASFDEADYPAGGMLIEGSRQLFAQFSGVSAGATVQLRLQVAVLQQVAG